MIPERVIETKGDVRELTVILVTRLPWDVAHIDDGEGTKALELRMSRIHVILILLEVLDWQLNVGREGINLGIG